MIKNTENISKTLVEQLITTSIGKASLDAPYHMLQILMQVFDLKAASFYSFNEENKILSLRAQIGFEFDDYKSFSLTLESMAGNVALNKIYKYTENVNNEANFKDKKLALKFNLKNAIFIPLLNKIEIENNPPCVGVLCCYLNDAMNIDIIENLISSDCVISSIYKQSLENDKLKLREEILEKAISTRDLNSFLHSTTKLLKEKWDYEAVSVYIYDDRANVIRLRATTGVHRETDLHSTFLQCDDDDVVANCFSENQPLLINGLSKSIYPEKITGELISTLCVPILEKSSKEFTPQTIGVLKVVNKSLKHGAHVEVLPFSWEDSQFLHFVNSVIGVISSMYSRNIQISDDIERGLHGLSSLILAIRTGLNLLTEFSQNIKNIESKFTYVIPDALNHLEAITWQLDRYTQKSQFENINLIKTGLMGDVLSKIPSMLQPYATAYNAKSVTMSRVQEDFKNAPFVLADAKALITVFRNLVENSIKYSKEDVALYIRIHWYDADKYVKVLFEDNGIGIEERDKDYVFRDGYKAENAMRRCTVGAGLGLNQCLKIMQSLNGSINLINLKYPTRFEINIPKYKGQS
jgi:two-component sensor histidine kinase